MCTSISKFGFNTIVYNASFCILCIIYHTNMWFKTFGNLFQCTHGNIERFLSFDVKAGRVEYYTANVVERHYRNVFYGDFFLFYFFPKKYSAPFDIHYRRNTHHRKHLMAFDNVWVAFRHPSIDDYARWWLSGSAWKTVGAKEIMV